MRWRRERNVSGCNARERRHLHPVITYKIVYAIAAASANLLGALAVTTRARWSVRALDGMLAFAAGFMIAVGLIDLLPEALARGGHTAAGVGLGGYLAVHIIPHAVGMPF